MGMAPFPTLWQHLKCGLYFAVDTVNPETYREPNGFVELYCPHCKQWSEPIAPNGWRR